MRTIRAGCWTHHTDAYLWTETGEGQLRLVTGVRRDWWIVTGHCSLCSTPDTLLYVFDNDAERMQQERDMRARLASRRVPCPAGWDHV